MVPAKMQVLDLIQKITGGFAGAYTGCVGDKVGRKSDTIQCADVRVLSRVISLVENRSPQTKDIIDALYPHTGKAFVLGITGPPGAGKSSVIDKLITQIRGAGQRVAIIAIDPSSPFSGGAVLGDRIRMLSHTTDDGVYVRSLSTRGKHGGLSHATREVAMVLDAAGFDWILVETAGVGQTELDILKLAHLICVVLVPESGDGIQVMKAGLMEIADIFVVNKCDRPEADALVKELLEFSHSELLRPEHLQPEHVRLERERDVGATLSNVNATSSNIKKPVIKSQAIHNQGIKELYEEVMSLRNNPQLQRVLGERRQAGVREELIEILLESFNQGIAMKFNKSGALKIINAVYNRIESPYKAARKILSIKVDKKTLK